MAIQFKSLFGGESKTTDDKKKTGKIKFSEAYKKSISTLAAKTGMSPAEAEECLKEARSRLGIEPKDYVQNRFYDLTVEEQAERWESIREVAEQKKEARKLERTIFLQRITAATGWPEEAAVEKARRAKKEYGISLKEYTTGKYFELSDEEMAEKHQARLAANERRNERRRAARSKRTRRATLLFAGEIPFPEVLKEERDQYSEEELSYHSCFDLMRPVIDRADLSVASLSESFDYPDDYIKAIKDSGFDLLTIGARNTETGGEKIRKVLDEQEINYPTGRMVGSTVVTVDGIRIGIIDLSVNLAFRELSLLSEALIKVRELNAQQVDLKICYVHWRYFIDIMLSVDERQRATAKALANLGIDYVVGAGSRYTMGYETVSGAWNRKMPIAYSLGSLLNCSVYADMNASAVLLLKIKKTSDGRVTIEDSYLPCFTWTAYEGKRRRVQFLNDRRYRYPATDNLAEWRKQWVASRLGEGVSLCHDFDLERPAAPASDTDPVDWIADSFARDRLSEPGDLQKKILDSYRLTDEFRETYGKMLYGSEKYAHLIKGAEHYLRSNYPHMLEREDVRDIIVDMLYSRYVFDFTFGEYFGFHFYDKSIAERVDYISDRSRLNYYRRINMDEREKLQLDNKFACYEKLPDLFKREMLDVPDASQEERFVKYAEKYGRFIIKPVNGSLGQGVRIIDIKEHEDLSKLFSDLLITAGPFVCEELIVNKDYLRELHPESVNTVRVFTYNNDGDVKIICTYLRAGRGDTIVDNGGAGGLTAAINSATHTIESDAAIENGEMFEVHPDTGIRFKGFEIQDWDLLEKTVAEAANRYPTIKFIAWDMAHTDKGWQVVEGNSAGQMWVYQNSSGTGMRKETEDLIGWQNEKREDI